jgi:hypothetical protein
VVKHVSECHNPLNEKSFLSLQKCTVLYKSCNTVPHPASKIFPTSLQILGIFLKTKKSSVQELQPFPHPARFSTLTMDSQRESCLKNKFLLKTNLAVPICIACSTSVETKNAAK